MKEAIIYLLNARLEQLQRRLNIGMASIQEKTEITREIEKVKQLINLIETVKKL